MNPLIIDRLLTHPKRRTVVMIATLLTGLLFLLPSVDSFCAARSKFHDLQLQLDEANAQVARLPDWKKRREELRKNLTDLSELEFSDTEVEEFRSRLVEMVHQADCTMRRIRLTDPKHREWMKTGDDPRQDRAPKEAEGSTPFFLATRQLALSVEGPLDRVQNLLTELEKTKGMLHSTSVSIRRSDVNPQDVALDLELELFNLVLKSTVKI